MTKRLRGWKLEMETGMKRNFKKEDPTSTSHSGLATKLLHLWSCGLLSAVLVRELADLAMQDGASHVELIKLAEAGAWGAHHGSAHRDIMSKFCSDVKLPEPFTLKVPCVCPKTSLEKEDHAACFLPHLMFSHLGEHYPTFFHEAFSLGKDKLANFWNGVAKTGDDRLPKCLEKHWKQKTIPLFLHGDGVEFQTRDSLLVFSWGNFLGNSNAMKQHWLLASYPKTSTSKGTWPAIWKWLKWSFCALGKGMHPTVDPDGLPLEKGSIFYKVAGTSLHPQGLRACLWALLGDHEYFSNVLGLAHWSSHHPCWECDAQSFAGCDPTKHFKEIDLEKSDFEIASHARCLEKPSSKHPVFQLPNLSTKMARGDPLHILFSKGLHSHLMGSILHYACYWEGPGKACVERPWKRLGLIFEAIQEEYKEQELDNRLTNLKLSMFTDANKPWATTASLHIKAGEAKHLLPALVPVLEKIFAGTMKEEESKMIHAASSLEKLVKLWDTAGEFLTPAEFETAMALGKEFLLTYKWLHSWSLEKDRNSFAIVAKHHTFIHLVMNCKFGNPKRQWCFRGEDYVGHISKMCHSISFGVSSTKLTTKLCPKYRLLVHFLLTRSMQLDSLDPEED